MEFSCYCFRLASPVLKEHLNFHPLVTFPCCWEVVLCTFLAIPFPLTQPSLFSFSWTGIFSTNLTGGIAFWHHFQLPRLHCKYCFQSQNESLIQIQVQDVCLENQISYRKLIKMQNVSLIQWKQKSFSNTNISNKTTRCDARDMLMHLLNSFG